MKSHGDDREQMDMFIAGLYKESELSDDPVMRERFKSHANMVVERREWRLIKTWPGLFQLYSHPQHGWKAELHESHHLRPSESEARVLCATKALFAMHLAAKSPPRQDVVKISDIPDPISYMGGGSNVLEVHETARRLFFDTLWATAVFSVLQQTLGPRIRGLLEGSSEERMAQARELKKDMEKAIDGIAFGTHKPTTHGSKHVVETAGGCSVLVSSHAIEAARKFVEEHQRLPSKDEVREKVLAVDPRLSDSPRSFWTNVWREAGLKKLPKGRPVVKRQKGQLDKVRTKFTKISQKS